MYRRMYVCPISCDRGVNVHSQFPEAPRGALRRFGDRARSVRREPKGGGEGGGDGGGDGGGGEGGGRGQVMEVRVAVRAVGVTVAVGMEVGEPVEWLYLNGFCLVVVWLLYDNGLFVWLLYGCCLVVVYRIP